jgi:hypothetical protein
MMDDRKQRKKEKNNGDEELMMALQKQHTAKNGMAIQDRPLVILC